LIIIGDAGPEDLDGIMEVERTSFDRPYPRGLMRFYLVLSEGLFIVAKDNDRIIGYAIGLIQRGLVGHIISIAVLKGYRNKGIGTALLRELESRMAKRGAAYFVLETSVEWNAKEFYFRRGYYVVRFLRSYYNKSEHGLLMIKPAKSYTNGFE